MKTDIILAGVGGQGILSIAAIIAAAALKENLYVKQAEVHGMSQRGGDVQSNLRISDRPVASDLIPLGKADLIISLEPMEALRYLPYLNEKGWLVTNSTPFINIDNYPDVEMLEKEIAGLGKSVIFDMDRMAKDVASPRSSNMVLLGAASSFLTIKADDLEESIRNLFQRKGNTVVEQNIKAFRSGREYASERSQNLF